MLFGKVAADWNDGISDGLIQLSFVLPCGFQPVYGGFSPF
jgi:hypothetical protein